MTHANFVLPPSVVSKIDVSRLVSEMERVDNELNAASARAKTDEQPAEKPVPSEQLTTFLELNKVTLEAGHERSDLIKELRLLKDTVPVMHMTFAVPADRDTLQQLAAWLRASVHPQAVISDGLQPSLVAGVYLRTPNHVHDLSLRAMLDGSHDVLIKELETLREGTRDV